MPPRGRRPTGTQKTNRRRSGPEDSPPRSIIILSRRPRLYSTRRLVQAARERGHRAEVLDTLRCTMVLRPGRPGIIYGGRDVEHPSVVIPRIGASITRYGLAVVEQFDIMGVPVLNGSLAIARSRDKLRALQILSRFGLDMPRTAMARNPKEVPAAVEQIGGLPAVVKLIQGTQGVGVMIAHTEDEMASILDTFWELGQDILIQEFIEESKGRDIRAIVAGGRVVGAMRRVAPAGEFRSNIHRGGEGEPIELTPEYTDAALRAARAVGLELAGVDLLESNVGPKVMEVNSSPGFEGLEKATGRDIAGAIIEHAAHFVNAVERGWVRPLG